MLRTSNEFFCAFNLTGLIAPLKLYFIAVGCLSLLALPAAAQTKVEQREKLKSLQAGVGEVRKLFDSGKFDAAGEKISVLQKELGELLQTKDTGLHRDARKIHAGLAVVHAKLELEGAALDKLVPWEELTQGEAKPSADSEKPKTGMVSFREDVAPWLVTACGNCHIAKRSGNFSLATYNDLMKGSKGGTVLTPGSKLGNRIVEVIESGEMPRGGAKVTKEELAALSQWIAEGAKFDGPNPTATLPTFVNAKGDAGAKAVDIVATKATGNETVSFARDVAPILKDNCNGCHINGRQASGNLRMDSFTQLLRGGDRGAIVSAGKPADSLLIKKLKGEAGQRMPAGGRPALLDSQIQMISKWIEEGATFDGGSPEANIENVVSQAWAAQASHDELFTKRQQRAIERWSKVLPNDKPVTAKNEQVMVLGNVRQERVDELLKLFGRATTQVAKSLDAPTNEPLVRGGVVVFVLKSRYDYGEFGRMTESRELPKEWQAHWQASPLDVYAVMADDAGAEDKQQSAMALQVTAGAYLGSFNGVPIWFAEGVARNLVLQVNRRSDERVKAWQAAMPVAFQKVDKSSTLLEGKLDEESSGLVGMGITGKMMDRSNKRRFDGILSQLKAGKTFDEALAAAFGPPAALLKSWFGR
jgi:mono/diheme cytochrome c family protein